MIGTKCRLSFIQYLPAKPTKWGIKVWVCADADGLAYDVVMRLLQTKFNKGYSVFVDNFYTSPNLFLHLFKKV